MANLPATVKTIKIINIITAVLLIIFAFVMSRATVGLVNLLVNLKSDSKIGSIPPPPYRSAILIVSYFIVLSLALFWQTYNLGRLKKGSYWIQIILFILILVSMPMSIFAILQVITIFLLLPKKTRILFGISK